MIGVRGIRKIQPTLSLDPTGSVFWVIGLSLSSLPQHFSTTHFGQGRFRGLLLCAAIETQQAATAEVPTGRRVCKLLCKQGLLVVQWQLGHPPLCLEFYRLRQLVSNSQQHPSRVVTTSLCYRSDIPSLRTPMSRSRASKQLSDATLVFR